MNNGKEYIIEMKRSKRKSISFEIKHAGTLIVRVPYYMTKQAILKEVARHQEWIEEHMELVREREARMEEVPRYTVAEMQKMADTALKMIPPKVKKYAERMGVSYGRITIRNQRTRWGSCSSKGNLNFNCLLTQVPEEVMDYVIIHELCHRLEMNHSKRFWNLVEQNIPDYKEKRQWLKEHGKDFIGRLG